MAATYHAQVGSTPSSLLIAIVVFVSSVLETVAMCVVTVASWLVMEVVRARAVPNATQTEAALVNVVATA